MNELLKLDNFVTNFNSIKPRFSQSSHLEVQKQSKRLIELRFKVHDNESKLYKKIDVEELFINLIDSLKKDKEINLKSGELRTIAYNFGYKTKDGESIFDSDKFIVEVFLKLNANWKTIYYFGIFESILSNWYEIEMGKLNRLITIYLRKLKQEKKPTLRLQRIIKSVDFIEPKMGEIVFSYWLTNNKISYTQISTVLGLKKSDLHLKYFSKVLIEYVKQNYFNQNGIDIDKQKLAHIFELHPNKDVHKLIIANLVNYENSETKKEELKKLAYQVFGDTKTDTNWNLKGFLETNDNIALIKQARRKLDFWITQSFITIFFEKCIHDDDRRRFWMQYAKYVEDIKIVGAFSQKHLLKYQGLDDYIEDRYIRTRSNESILAIIMEIKNYQIIEYSDKGSALYVYLKDGINVINLSKTRVFTSVSDLKKTHLPTLFSINKSYYRYSENEGRLPHKKGWERSLKYWMQDNLGI